MLLASRRTRNFGDRVAGDDVSFEIGRGEVFGLLGPNGAGIERGTADHIRKRIGFLTETPGLWEQLTVADNMMTYAELFSVPDREFRANPTAVLPVALLVLVCLPLMIMLVGQIVGAFVVTITTLILVAAAMAVAWGLLLMLSVALFQRETILTRWK